MRPVLAPLIVAPLAALAAPDLLAPFELAMRAVAANSTSPNPDSNGNSLSPALLLKRQNANACAPSYYPCAAVPAPDLCCPRTAVCTADANHNPACCPQGAVCTGALGTPRPGTISLPSSVIATITATNAGPAPSILPNPYYPFPVIPTTYPNAAACSAAYTSCHREASACTTALANGAMGVTVVAPNEHLRESEQQSLQWAAGRGVS
ncbi:hypothetical protein ACEQ8H_001852 [Pleosporales sp. CAS-2024a]